MDAQSAASAASPSSTSAPAAVETPKAQAKKRPAIVSSPDKAVLCLEDTWHITTANRDTKVILGYESAEVLGQPLTLLIPDELQKEAGAHTLEFLLNQSPLPHGAFQMIGRRKDETVVPVLVSFSETKSQRGRAYVCLIRRDQTMENPPEETEAEVAEPAVPSVSPVAVAEPLPAPTQTEVLEESLGDMAERLSVLETQLVITQAALLEAQSAQAAQAQAAAAAPPVIPADALPEAIQTLLEHERAERARVERQCARLEADLQHLNGELISRKALEECLRNRETELQRQLEQESERARQATVDLLKARAELRAGQQHTDVAPADGTLRQELADLRSRITLMQAQGETLNSRLLTAMSALEAARQDASSLSSNLAGTALPPKPPAA